MQVVPTEVWKPTCEANQIVKISSGTDHVLALCRNKTVLTWGSGQQGQLGRVGTRVARRGHTLLDAYLVPAAMHLPFSLRRHPVEIAAGHYVSYVILSDGEVYSCGLNNYGQLGTPSSATEAVRTLLLDMAEWSAACMRRRCSVCTLENALRSSCMLCSGFTKKLS